MNRRILNQLHQNCKPDLFAKYQALYEGGELFRQNIKQFMNQSVMENNFNYQLRRREAFYQSYINSIVDQFASQLFSSPFIIRPSQDSDPFYSEFKEDVDLVGTDLMTYMRFQFICALVKGCSWILAEMPDDGDPPPENLLDYQDRNLGRAWLCKLKPEHVLDWEYDDYKQLQWVITYCKQVRRPSPRDKRTFVEETWCLYDQQDVETFQLTYDLNNPPAEDVEVPSIEKKVHGFTRVPLIEMKMPHGLWLVDRLADTQIEHFRANNALAWSMRRACYPVAVFKTDEDDSGSLVASSDGFGVKIGKEESLSYIEAPSSSFDTQLERVASLKDELHRLSLQMSLAVDNSPAALKRSGDSKAADAQATEICLHAFADIIKSTVEEIFELISDARGDTKLTFSIEGMDQFNVLDTDQILNAAKTIKELGIKSPTALKEINYKAVEAMLFNLNQEVKDKIRQEIMSVSDEEMMPQPEPVEEDPMNPQADKPNMDVSVN